MMYNNSAKMELKADVATWNGLEFHYAYTLVAW